VVEASKTKVLDIPCISLASWNKPSTHRYVHMAGLLEDVLVERTPQSKSHSATHIRSPFCGCCSSIFLYTKLEITICRRPVVCCFVPSLVDESFGLLRFASKLFLICWYSPVSQEIVQSLRSPAMMVVFSWFGKKGVVNSTDYFFVAEIASK
jgi:hypothetical protein